MFPASRPKWLLFRTKDSVESVELLSLSRMFTDSSHILRAVPGLHEPLWHFLLWQWVTEWHRKKMISRWFAVASIALLNSSEFCSSAAGYLVLLGSPQFSSRIALGCSWHVDACSRLPYTRMTSTTMRENHGEPAECTVQIYRIPLFEVTQKIKICAHYIALCCENIPNVLRDVHAVLSTSLAPAVTSSKARAKICRSAHDVLVVCPTSARGWDDSDDSGSPTSAVVTGKFRIHVVRWMGFALTNHRKPLPWAHRGHGNINYSTGIFYRLDFGSL